MNGGKSFSELDGELHIFSGTKDGKYVYNDCLGSKPSNYYLLEKVVMRLSILTLE
jgi:hypothetical protein